MHTIEKMNKLFSVMPLKYDVLSIRVARGSIFIPKFLEGLGMKKFGLFYGPLVYFTAIL
jgi:hypothetical protein